MAKLGQAQVKLKLLVELVFKVGCESGVKLIVWVGCEKKKLMLNSTQVKVKIEDEVEPGTKNVCQYCNVWYDILIPDTLLCYQQLFCE